MKWIKITNQMPPFDKKVLFRAVCTWKGISVHYFSDEMTMDEERLEYGITAYLLRDNDYFVSKDANINDVTKEYVTHWAYLPEDGTFD